jgi:tetratricopeptide (TPR) repeat protein
VLSQLGDFDAALRETRRALELEPLYVPAEVLAHDRPAVRRPDHRHRARAHGRRSGEDLAGEFASTPPCSISSSRSSPAAHGPGTAARGDALDSARDYIAKGLLDLAIGRAEPGRRPGRRRGSTAVLLGDIFAKRGLYGEALERYRAARAADPDDPDATLARSARSWRSGGPATRRRSPTSSPAGCGATSRSWWPGRGCGWR